MKKTTIVFFLFFSIYSYSQKMEISRNKILKITLKEKQKVHFFENDVLIKKVEFKGTKNFKIENLKDYKLTWKNDKKSKIFSVFFKDEIQEFIQERVIDFNEM